MNPAITKLPGIPRPPSDASPALRIYLEALAEAIDIRLGRRGDPVDRAVTLRELINSGLAKELQSRPFDPNSSGDNPGFASPTAAVVTEVPLQPTGFTAEGAYSVINLVWDFANYSTHAATEIWAHSSDVLGDATLVGVSVGRTYLDAVGGGVTRYYWIRHVNTAGVAGPYNASAGTVATTATDVAHQLAVLGGAITASQLATSLATPIGNLPANTNQTIATTNSTVSGINTTVGNHTTSIQQQATSINGLSGQYSVKIDTNGHVAGFGLSNTTVSGTPSSAFIIRADKFAIIDPANTTTGLTNSPPTATIPFFVSGGTTYIKAAAILDASITAAKIGSVNADTITTGTLDVTNRIVTDSIDARKLVIGGSVIGSEARASDGKHFLKIGAASITEALIGDAQISTLKVAGNAITATGYATKGYSSTNNLTLTMTAASNVTAGQPYIFVVSAIVPNVVSNNAVLGGSNSTYDLKITTRSNGQSAQTSTDWLYAWGTDTISVRRTSAAAGHAVSCTVECFVHATTTAVPSSRIQITGHTGLR
jgi:hypothetical protein